MATDCCGLPLQLDKLQQLPVVRQLTALPLVSSLVQAFLPSLVLRIFLVVLPYLLSYMGHMVKPTLPIVSHAHACLCTTFF